MNKILELREKRAKVWEDAKKTLIKKKSGWSACSCRY